METRGIIREIDRNGRLVIPYDWRKEFGMVNGAKVEIVATKDGVLVKPVKGVNSN